ncbi:MAG: CooT family nickel-binding protein [Archaeoglobaceae archaeon]|nr:CooT family nickel-binding protein [Archaeoglobaceae archaeon]MDW8118005.1 CooT family nickel-binding protein [Archaeoglobaceae archaeon]
MCESKVFSASGELLMEDVVRIKVEGDVVRIWDILGSLKEIRGKILEIDLIAHKAILGVY